MLIRPQVTRPRPRTFSTAQGQAKAKATLLPYETKLKLVTSLTYCTASQLTYKYDNNKITVIKSAITFII